MPPAAWGSVLSRTKDFLPLAPACLCRRAFSNMASNSAHGRGQKCQRINTSGSHPHWGALVDNSPGFLSHCWDNSKEVSHSLPETAQWDWAAYSGKFLINITCHWHSPFLILSLGLIPGIISQINYSHLPLGNLHEDRCLLWEGTLPPGPQRKSSSSPWEALGGKYFMEEEATA